MESSRLRLRGVLFAVSLDRGLYLVDERVRRAVKAPGKGLQGDMAHRLWIGDMQRLKDVTFRNMADPGDVGDCHPGANGPHIPGERHMTTLLEALNCLHGLYGAENRQAQCET